MMIEIDLEEKKCCSMLKHVEACCSRFGCYNNVVAQKLPMQLGNAIVEAVVAVVAKSAY